ncbi:MAG: hypothetical protein ACREUW_10775 [Burkholderiales bacterium]
MSIPDIPIIVSAVIWFTLALASLVLAALLSQSISLLLFSLLSAAILLWRARKLKGWIIAYKDALGVALKAGFCGLVVAFVFSNAAPLAHATGIWNVLGNVVGSVLAIVVWWNVHSRALLKLANTLIPLTVKDARTISTSVCGYLFIPLFVLGAILVAIIRHSLGIT